MTHKKARRKGHRPDSTGFWLGFQLNALQKPLRPTAGTIVGYCEHQNELLVRRNGEEWDESIDTIIRRVLADHEDPRLRRARTRLAERYAPGTIRPASVVETLEDIDWLFEGKPSNHTARVVCGYCGAESNRLTRESVAEWFRLAGKRWDHACVARFDRPSIRRTLSKGAEMPQTQEAAIERLAEEVAQRAAPEIASAVEALLHGRGDIALHLAQQPSPLSQLVSPQVIDLTVARQLRRKTA